MNINCNVYIAQPMSGVDRPTQIKRAKYLCTLARQYGLTPISPVIEEGVADIPGVLINDSEMRLKGFWRRDKQIIRNRDGNGAHVVLIDGADKKSFGCEREYALNRFCLWKPTVMLNPNQKLSVAQFEDDYITNDEHVAFIFIQKEFGTCGRRAKWRIPMLLRSLPGWLLDQINAWR